MSIVTRFAPSPTGFLHIGGARTALFNWLFARHHGGQFHLRIEDTDRARSTDAAIKAILEGLQWLNLNWDGDIIYQFARASRHAAVALSMVDSGAAYRCYCSIEDVAAMREQARATGKQPRYDGRCRNRPLNQETFGQAPVIRLRMPDTGSQTVKDLVQGDVTVANTELDDLILLRADGTPTYMLSVVVDDHDMQVTHIIRGDDHLTNTFRQYMIYKAMGWPIPHFAHIPLIHGADGAKLSKRHGALGVEAYRDMGLLPEAVCNYLVRLGWSHGDDEIFSRTQAIQWFDLNTVGRAPARFDMAKLHHINAHYLRETNNQDLVDRVMALQPSDVKGDNEIDTLKRQWLYEGMDALKQRAKTLHELVDNAQIYLQNRPIALDASILVLLDELSKDYLRQIVPLLEHLEPWSAESLETCLRAFSTALMLKFGQIAQPLRAALTGKSVSPGVFEIMAILGRKESLARIQDVLC